MRPAVVRVCDDGQFVALDAATGRVLETAALSGPPDVIFVDPKLARCLVAVGDPGVIDVIDLRTTQRVESVPTEPGAHPTALDAGRHRLYVFLPEDTSRGRLRRRVARCARFDY